MSRFHVAAVAILAVAEFATSAMAAQPATRLRGTIKSVGSSTLVITSYTGKTIDVAINSGTKYAWVKKSSLSSIKTGDFIGTAATGPTSHLMAQEVVIFPNSMRGTGEGHYPWSMPAAVAKADAGGSAMPQPKSGSMTNGTVSSAGAPMAKKSSMTNGTVSHKTGGKMLTVTYDNDKKVMVEVPSSAPVVRFDPAGKSIATSGAKTFVVATGAAGDTLTAKFVAVGKNGLMPPM